MRRKRINYYRAQGYLAALIDTMGNKDDYSIALPDYRICQEVRSKARRLGLNPEIQEDGDYYIVRFPEEEQKEVYYMLAPIFAKRNYTMANTNGPIASLGRIRKILEEQEENRKLSVTEHSILQEAKKGKDFKKHLPFL
jgi:hypothetical protein